MNRRMVNKNIRVIKEARLHHKTKQKVFHKSHPQPLSIQEVNYLISKHSNPYAKYKRNVSKSIKAVKQQRSLEAFKKRYKKKTFIILDDASLPTLINTNEKVVPAFIPQVKRKVKVTRHEVLLNILYLIFVFPLFFLFSSSQISSKPLRYFDRFLKFSFHFMIIALLGLNYIINKDDTALNTNLIYHKNDSFVYDNQGVLIGRISQNRARSEQVTNVNYNQLSQSTINSLVGVEDAYYFKHRGVDLLNTAENGFKSVVLKSSSAGGSTITQQLIGQTHLDKGNDVSITRKLKEIFLSFQADTKVSKNAMLTSYLNYFPYGQQNIHGIQLASEYFF
ncbi:MAG: transglycosylase domain-containing protein, partial [Bacilli bacterium]